MKLRIIILYLLLYAYTAHTQTPLFPENDVSKNRELLGMFDQLSPEMIKTNLLIDKVIPFVCFTKYDGKDSIGVVSLKDWREIYTETNLASITDTLFQNIKATFKDAYRTKDENNVIPFGVINVKYNKFKDSALLKDLIYYQDGKLFNKPTKSESPYNEKRVFAAVPLIDELNLTDNHFVFSDKYYFTNDTAQIDHLEVDFDNGLGFNTYSMNETINVDYTLTGEKLIQIKIVFKNESELSSVCRGKINYFNIPKPDLQISFDKDHFPQLKPYTKWVNTGNENDKFGEYGQAIVSIWYANGNKVLTKPFILLDGFDPGEGFYDQARHWNHLYGDLNQVNTADILKSQCYNYDIITVDWVGGADWIQKNAYVLVEILKWVNANKIGFNQNIVVGPSMGGIIGKYALSYMEKNNINHDVSVFVPWDSPHRGANIPLGLQCWASFYGSDSEQMNNFVDVLNSPAAKQLLNYHYSMIMKEPTTVDASKLTHPLRTELLKELMNLGNYPEKPILIGISNGSGSGHPQNNKHAEDLKQNEIMMRMETVLTIIGQNEWPTVAKANVFSIPLHEEKVIFEGSKLYNTKKVIVYNAKPYDNAPGGFFPHLDQIPSVMISGDKKTYINLYHPYICFIPTISALDLDYPTYIKTGQYQNENVFYNPIDVSKTPFDYIMVAPSKPSSLFESGYQPTFPYSFNENHSSTTVENRDMLLSIVGNNFPKDLKIQNKTLFNPLIDKKVNIQAINSITAGANVESAKDSGSVNIISGNQIVFQTENEINIEPGFEAADDFETIIMKTDPKECDPICHFSPAIEEVSTSPLGNICAGMNISIFAKLNHPGYCYYDNESYTWWVMKPGSKKFQLLGEKTYTLPYKTNISDSGNYVFLVQASNAEGAGNIFEFNLFVKGKYECSRETREETTTIIAETKEIDDVIKVYPNPSKGNVTIYTEIQNDATNEIKMFDMVGNKVKQIELKGGINKVSVTNLKPGVYFYQYSNNGQILKSDKIVVIE